MRQLSIILVYILYCVVVVTRVAKFIFYYIVDSCLVGVQDSYCYFGMVFCPLKVSNVVVVFWYQPNISKAASFNY